VRYLRAYSVPKSGNRELPEKEIEWVIYKLNIFRGRGPVLQFIRDLELTGHILTDLAETVVDNLAVQIRKRRPDLNIDIKAWDHNDEHMYWPSTDSIKDLTTSVQFVNRCNNSASLVEPFKTLPDIKKLQRLDFWVRLHQKNDFEVFTDIGNCVNLKELRIKVEFDGYLEKVTQKFITSIKFPKSLTSLYLNIAGLRLGWVGDMPKSKYYQVLLESFYLLSILCYYTLFATCYIPYDMYRRLSI